MANGTHKVSSNIPSGGVFAGAAAVWLVLDVISKRYFESAYALGQTSAADFGLFRFRLVHNTGAAWGVFGDSTFALAVVSLIVCAGILALYLFYERLAEHRPSVLETASLALIFSGGIGNAIDRFAQGYVVDFIEFTFIDFPVFNIADIGVTCGFVLLIGGFLLSERRMRQERGEDAAKEAGTHSERSAQRGEGDTRD